MPAALSRVCIDMPRMRRGIHYIACASKFTASGRVGKCSRSGKLPMPALRFALDQALNLHSGKHRVHKADGVS